jgi:glycosyltransferase involved in cell wall biosynthesis
MILDCLDIEHFTGIQTFAYNITKKILELDKENTYYLLHSRNTHLDIYDYANEIIIPYRGLSREIRYLFQLPMFLKKYHFDIVFTPEHFPPLFMKSKTIMTVHDLSPLICAYTRQHPIVSKLKHKYFFRFVLNKFTQRIVAVSDNTKRDIVKYLHIPENKIYVINHGLSRVFAPCKENSSLFVIKNKYNLPNNFILCVATLEPRKNFISILDSYYQLKKQGFNQQLVVVGMKGWRYNNIFSKIKQLNFEKDVIFTGYVPEEDLPIIYSLADLFVYPSLYEGFGFPPLEAMACGCPVISSNTSCLPELVGEAAIKINPCDNNELTKAMANILGNQQLKNEMINKGFSQACKFSWDIASAQYIRIFNMFLRSSEPNG